MIEPLTIVNTGTMAAKINELVDQVNAISPVTTFTSGYITEVTPKTEPTESKTSSAEKVLKYCRQKGVMCENSSNLGFCSLTACNKEQYNMQSIIKPTEKMYTLDEVAEMFSKLGILPCRIGFSCIKCSFDHSKKNRKDCYKMALQSGWLKGE